MTTSSWITGNRIALGGLFLLACLALPGPATAACAGDTCSLGSRLRVHGGDGLPISMAPAPDGDLRLGQPGLVVATPAATVMQPSPGTGTPGAAARSVMLAPGTLTFKGGISRPSIVTWCAGLPDAIASFNPRCAAPGSFGIDSSTSSRPNTPLSKGFVRYAATRSQLSGQGQGQVSGTAQIFFDGGGLAPGDLPCVWGTTVNTAVSPRVDPGCIIELAVKQIPESAGEHQTITTGGSAMRPIPLAGRKAGQQTGQKTMGRVLPGPTGRVTLSMTQNAGTPTQQENLVQTGNDPRAGGDQGRLEMTSGATSTRSIIRPNADQRWLTLDMPGPGALAAFSAGLLVLLGCRSLLKRLAR